MSWPPANLKVMVGLARLDQAKEPLAPGTANLPAPQIVCTSGRIVRIQPTQLPVALPVAYDVEVSPVPEDGRMKAGKHRCTAAFYAAGDAKGAKPIAEGSFGFEVHADGSVELVRHYGWYAVRSRAQRRSKDATPSAKPQPDGAAPPGATERRRAWARLIRQVFEVDPLACPKCGGRMRVISFVTRDQPHVLEQILEHVGEASHPERFPEDCADWEWDQRSPDQWQ